MANPTDPDAALLSDYFSLLDPVWVPDTPTVDGTPVVVVPVTKSYGDALFGKPRGVRVDRGTPVWLRLVLYSPATGAPIKVDVGSYSTPPTVNVRYREATGFDNRIYVPDDTDTASLESSGRSVLLPLPLELKNGPGIYSAQAQLLDGTGVERNRSSFWVIVDRGLFNFDGGAPCDDRGPPTFDEVRTLLRDHPGANRLFQDFGWDAAEIGQSIVGGIQQFNTTPPIGGRTYSSLNWPSVWRRQLLDGCMAYLMETMAEWMQRSHLPYSAGGTTIDDLGKSKDYQRSAEMYAQRFDKWCRLTRVRQSVDTGWGSVGSGGPGVIGPFSW